MNRPISEKEQEAQEIVETDEVLDFYEFEDEEYLADAAAPPRKWVFSRRVREVRKLGPKAVYRDREHCNNFWVEDLCVHYVILILYERASLEAFPCFVQLEFRPSLSSCACSLALGSVRSRRSSS